MFAIVNQPIDPESARSKFTNLGAGGLVVFEGRVRNVNEGRPVNALEYEVFHELCRSEAELIIREAKERFSVIDIFACHREGYLLLGDVAVWIGVSARHRDDAFKACRYVIDEIKHRLPIWKKEHYVDGPSEWINCQGCATRIPFSENDFYVRQSCLPEFADGGQARLKSARALVVGAGGLGVPVMTSLVAAGVGEVVIVDDDMVDVTNLHRQTIYRADQVGLAKAALAAENLGRLNPFVNIRPRIERLTVENARSLVEACDVVVDCTDNFQAKFLLQDMCHIATKPLFTASIHRFDGTIHVYIPGQSGACLRCLWPETPSAHCVSTCADSGVLAAAVGSLGNLQALEVIKYLLCPDDYRWGGYLTLDLSRLETSRIETLPAANCPLCSAAATIRRIEDISVEADLKDAALLEVNAAQVMELDALFIDIRETHERGDLPSPFRGMMHVPLSTEDFHEKIPESRVVVLVCQRGVRSLRKVQELRRDGFMNVLSLKGGIASAGTLQEAHRGCRH